MVSDQIFDSVSQNGHTLAGVASVTIPLAVAAVTQTPVNESYWWIPPIVLIVIMAGKEFIYDEDDEAPDVRGSNARDWANYIGGVLSAIEICFLPHWWRLCAFPWAYFQMKLVGKLFPLPPGQD